MVIFCILNKLCRISSASPEAMNTTFTAGVQYTNEALIAAIRAYRLTFTKQIFKLCAAFQAL
jgi:hypothetical protein